MCWLFFSGQLTPKLKHTGPYNSYKFYLCNKPKISPNSPEMPKILYLLCKWYLYCFDCISLNFHPFQSSRAHFQGGTSAGLFMALLEQPLHHSLSQPVKKCRCIYVNGTYIVLTVSPPILIHFECSRAHFLGGGIFLALLDWHLYHSFSWLVKDEHIRDL